MRHVTSLIAVALAIGAVIVPGAGAVIVPGVAQAATAKTATLTFAPASNGALVPGQDLVITGSITNPTSTAIEAGSASVVLDPAPVRSRSELASWLSPTSTSASDALGTVVGVAATPTVPAGNTIAMQFTVPAAAIDLGPQSSIWGARTLAVHVTAGGRAVGQARSSIVWDPGTGVQQTRLGLVMPLTVPSSADGLIPSDLLAAYTGVGGPLSRELDAVLNRPGVTIGIDPRVLASIRILGTSTPPSADAWLKRLESATNDTFALSYADEDIAAASQAKSPRLLAPVSFPVNPKLFPNAPTATPTQQSTGTPAPTPTAGTPGTVAPLPDLASLQAFPYTTPAVAWPAEGSVVAADLTAFAAGGLTTSILSSGNVGYGNLGYTPSSAALVGGHNALVSDDGLSRYLNAAVGAPTTELWNRAMSDLSSAIAVVTLERPETSRILLASLSRTVSSSDTRLAQTISALAQLPWAAPASLSQADAAFGAGSPVAPITATLAPTPEPAARVATVASLLAAEAAAGSFSSVLTDPTQITGERRLTLLALLSNSWVGDSGWAAAAKNYVAVSNRYATKSVTIARSSATVFTSRNSPLPITVSNELPWPVTVYVSVRSPSNIIIIDRDRVELTVEAQSQAKTTVPVTSNANGPVTLTVSLSSATNVQITTPTTIEVDVQAQWETAFTAIAAVLVLAVFGFGIYRTVAKRRRSRGVKRDRDAADPGPDPAAHADPTRGA